MDIQQSQSKIEDALFEITAFTVTYNRASTLVRTYNSLRNQTVRNFEWIVYDNGSTDNTKDLVAKWSKEADFPITYISRPDNSGWQRSFKHGIETAKGYFWLLVDSDDEVVPHAFERMVAIWKEIPEEQKPQFTGVTVNCIDQFGNLVGNEFPYNPTDSDSLEMYYKYKVKEEKFGMHRVDVLKNFPFPDVPEHVNPSVVWWKIAREYKTRFANEALRIYYIEEEGRPDQLTFHTSLESNALGRRMNHMHSLNHNITWFRYDPVQFLKHAALYAACSKSLSVGVVSSIKEIKPLFSKLLVVLAYPVASLYVISTS